MASPARFAAPVPRLLKAVSKSTGVALPGDVRVAAALEGGGDPLATLAGVTPNMRILALGWIGTHRDARVATLERHWRLEEAARATGARVLALRLAPLIGRASPWLAWLARGPRLDARLARAVVQPVLESDVVATLDLALRGRAAWDGWYEVCGREPLSVGELAELAAARGAAAFDSAPACEPAPAILAAQGLAEWRPWAEAFGLTPGSVVDTLGPRINFRARLPRGVA